MCTWRQNAISDMLRQKESPAKSERKVVQKDQLRYSRSLHNWVVYLKILIRQSLFYVNNENWDRNRPSNFPKAPGTKSVFWKEKVHRKGLSHSVRLMSVVLARPNSEKDHMRRPCTKKDAPAKQRRIWRTNFTSSRIQTGLRSFSPIEAKVMSAPTSTRPEEREFLVESGASMHMMSKKK